jgi:hypothetical protein
VIIDPLWGEPALAAMRVAADGVRHVQIGNSAAPTIELPATLIRSAACQILGFSVARAPLAVRRDAYRRLTELVAENAISIDVMRVPLARCRQRLGTATARCHHETGAHSLRDSGIRVSRSVMSRALLEQWSLPASKPSATRGEPDRARKRVAARRDFEGLKARRMRAADLFARGKRQVDVVRELGVSAQTACGGTRCGWTAVGRR